MLELTEAIMARHQAEARPLLKFEDIPLDLTDLRLMVRQTADILRRFGALEDRDHQEVQALGRDMKLLAVVGSMVPQRGGPAARRRRRPVGARSARAGGRATWSSQVLTQAMRPFLSRCAEVLQQRPTLALWTQPHCALCGGEPDFAVITPAAERHLICGAMRAALEVRAADLPVLPQQRPVAHHVVRHAGRPVSRLCLRRLPALSEGLRRPPRQPTGDAVVDSVATLPLDAAAMQRGYMRDEAVAPPASAGLPALCGGLRCLNLIT